MKKLLKILKLIPTEVKHWQKIIQTEKAHMLKAYNIAFNRKPAERGPGGGEEVRNDDDDNERGKARFDAMLKLYKKKQEKNKKNNNISNNN